MKVSIITVSFNAEETIERTLQSVLNQDYSNIEFIVIDGASTDGTQSIIDKYNHRIDHYLSEHDDGVYHAMNKGLALATGEIIAILNADDEYASTDVISRVVAAFQNKNTDTCYGDLEYVDRENPSKTLRSWKAGEYKPKAFARGWMPPHPSFFAKKKLYDEYGYFNTDLKTSADYELMLRFLHRYKSSTVYIPQVLVKMKAGGQSNVSLFNRLKANKEDRMAWVVNGLKPKPYTTILKPLRKVGQFFGI